MRNLSAGNKMNFTIFAFIIFSILIIIVAAVTVVLKNAKEDYQITSSSFVYDKDYNYIKLSNDAKITKKWNENYYLKENETNNEYELGKYAISYDTLRKNANLFGTFYQVLKGGDIKKLVDYNVASGSTESKFYKIDDRKYLLLSNHIENNTGSLSTQNYLIIIIDKLGNASLFNNKINIKTINEMIIKTDDYEFDVANEILSFDEEVINLKKIIGSTNQYIKVEHEDNDETNQQDEKDEKNENQGQNIVENTNNTTNENNNTTIMQNDKQETDNSWVASLNDWISNAASAFTSIYNKNNVTKEEQKLNKSITINSLSAGTTYIDIKYSIIDPEDKYNVVYAIISGGAKTYSISLDKKDNTYRVTGLEPDTAYTIELGYKIIYSDAKTEDIVQDTMNIRTTYPVEKLEITKVSINKIYYKLKLDSNFVYDEGAKIEVYLNDKEKCQTINLTSEDLEKAAYTGFEGSFNIPDEYKSAKGKALKIQLENTTYGGEEIRTNLMAKIVNY